MKIIWHVYVFLYILLYLGYFWWIDFMHSSFNVVSVTALVFPVVTIVALYLSLSQLKVNDRAKHVELVICLSLFVGAFYQLWVHEQQSNFSTAKWHAEPRERVWMVDDLLTKYDFTGMDVVSLESILGKESDTSYFEAPRRFVYYLGDERGFISIDSEWLIFDLNDEGIVTNVNIMRD